MNQTAIDLRPAQFEKISALVHRIAGIQLQAGKEALVRARLMRRLRQLGIERMEEYFNLIESPEGAGEVGCLIDAMTTNKTGFFREAEHFSFLRKRLLPEMKAPRLRIWSAACSSGEEPYSLSILLCEHLQGVEARDVRILATDISRSMLEKARRAVYPVEAIADLPLPRYRKYFIPLGNGPAGGVRVAEAARQRVHLAYLNLMGPWPMRGPFQVIFCRNAMIYFDRETQQHLVQRFWEILEKGGYLFVGHSEGLSGIHHRFGCERPAVYRKPGAP